VYAVTAYSVEQQTRDFGIRRALGARDGHVTVTVLGSVGRYAALGAGIGVILAALAGRLMSTLLFQVSPLDSLTYLAAVAVVLACAILAALVPAMRAVRINPVQALRYE
jgi:ABC-type antimicrobial peptide transport system permease subunit